MPYSSVSEVPSHVPSSKKKKWMAVWNATYNREKKQGNSAKEAEKTAFRNANGVTKMADPNIDVEVAKAKSSILKQVAGICQDILKVDIWQNGKERPHSVHSEESSNYKATTDRDEDDNKSKSMTVVESKSTFTREVVIKAIDDEEQIITGVVMEPTAKGDVDSGFEIASTDAHDDFTTEEEIWKANVKFMEQLALLKAEPHNVGHNNAKQPQTAIIENYVAPEDFTLGDETVVKGSWVQSTKIYDAELWKEIKKGDITGYSIEGKGIKTEVEDPS